MVTVPWPCLRALRTRFSTARSNAARSTLDGDVPLDDHLVRALREVLERDRLALGGGRRVLAGERQQIVEQLAEPRGAGLDLGDHRRVRAVASDVGRVPTQRGQRRAQLVRGVADEAVLGLLRALERGQHRVQRVRELADLVALVAFAGRRSAASPERSIARAPDDSSVSGRSARRVSSVARPAASTAAASAQTATSRRVWSSVRSISVRLPATMTAPPAASPRPSSPSGAA